MGVLSQYDLDETQKMHLQRVLRSILHGFITQEAAGCFRQFPVDITDSFQLAIHCFLSSLGAGDEERARKASAFCIDDAETVRYGSVFQRIICITGPFTAIMMVLLTIFQSVGQKLKPLVLSMLRKGGLDVPFIFLLNALVGVNGIAWATPMADLCAMAMGIVLFVLFWKKLTIAERRASGESDSQSGN